MTIPINEKFVTETLQRLVQIDSTNPTLGADNAGEGEIASALAELASEIGLQVFVYVQTVLCEQAPCGRPFCGR